jgi:hypothetical protein
MEDRPVMRRPVRCPLKPLRWWKASRKTGAWLARRKCRPWPEGLEDRALLSSITEYPILHGTYQPSVFSLAQITSGPDGNLWFTDATDGAIYRVTPDGTFTQFLMRPQGIGGSIMGISPRPDGTLAFGHASLRGRPGRDRHDHDEWSNEQNPDADGTWRIDSAAGRHDHRVGWVVMVDRREQRNRRANGLGRLPFLSDPDRQCLRRRGIQCRQSNHPRA